MAKSRRGADQSADQGDDQNTYGGEIRYDDFIRRIRPRPESTDPVTLLHGYVGESATEDKIRLYSDPSLASYVEIAIADILFSLPNDDDPLGGSRLWVKQNANAQYNEASSFAQGDMYNDYMSNAYTPGGYGNMDAGAVSVGQIACPVAITRGAICGPSQFICPTPASKLIICISRPILQCGIKSINKPCFPVTCQFQTRFPTFPPQSLAGCPSAFCTPGGGFPIDQGVGGGGGFMNDPYGNYAGGGNNDYTGGDMYNDYMQNQYDPGYENFGPTVAAATSPIICLQQVTTNLTCRTILNNCPTRQIWCRITPNRIMSICRPCWVTPVTPRTPITAGCPVGPGGPVGGGFMNDPYGGNDPYSGYGDYTGGEMYSDYMNNAYAPDAGYSGMEGAAPQPAAANIPHTLPVICRRTVIPAFCPTHFNFPPCRTRPWFTPCRITVQPSICCPTRANFPPCCRTQIVISCPVPRPTLNIQCGGNPGGGNFDTGYDPYGGGYGY